MTSNPKAFSYLRFSTPDQMKGDSFRRHTEAAQTYANRHELDLDDALSFRDLGVSAFRGTNFIEGALGKFIEAVDGGQVPRGSYLLVENLDRLSRDNIRTARDRFEAILDKGINIVTLTNQKTYSAEGYDLADMLMTLLDMSRAHEESALKSKRGKAAWENKRKRAAEENHVLTTRCPAWLEYKDGGFVALPERAAAVKRIYKLALKGHGTNSIARQLNKEGIRPFNNSDGWHHSYVRKILSTEAVVGRFQPSREMLVDRKRKSEPQGDPIEGYFPAVVSKEDFYRIKQAKPGVSGHKGKPLANVLSGLVYCGKCGGKLHYINKGKPPRGYSYLACDNARRKHTCDAKITRYDPIMNAIMNSLEAGELDIRAILSNGQTGKRQEIVCRIEAIGGQIDELETGNIRLADILQSQDSPSPTIETRLVENENTVTQLRGERVDLEAKLHSLKYGQDHLGSALQAMSDVRRRLDKGSDEEIGEVRVRLNASLKRLISTIEIGKVSQKDWKSDKPLWTNFQTLQDHVEEPMIPITVNFQTENQHLLIYANPKDHAKFIALGVKVDETGKIEKARLSGDSITLSRPEIHDAVF